MTTNCAVFGWSVRSCLQCLACFQQCLFVIDQCVPERKISNVISLGRCVPSMMRLLDDASPVRTKGRIVQRTERLRIFVHGHIVMASHPFHLCYTHSVFQVKNCGRLVDFLWQGYRLSNLSSWHTVSVYVSHYQNEINFQ
jgi:hypothetical protein